MTNRPIYLRVRNWSCFQHYKTRNPLWIKVYSRLLQDPEWAALPDNTRAHLLGLWILAPCTKNRWQLLPGTLQFLANAIHATSEVDWVKLIEGRWLEGVDSSGRVISASKLLAWCKQNACLERERERKECKSEPLPLSQTHNPVSHERHTSPTLEHVEASTPGGAEGEAHASVDTPGGAENTPGGAAEVTPHTRNGALVSGTGPPRHERVSMGVDIPPPPDEGGDANVERHLFPEAWELLASLAVPHNVRGEAEVLWRARVREGVPPRDMLAGVKRFVAFHWANKTEARYIPGVHRLFDPGTRMWAEPWDPEPPGTIVDMIDRRGYDRPHIKLESGEWIPVVEHNPT